MKRWLTKLVVFLLLGAVVNVAVAWGCAACLQVDSLASSGGTLYGPPSRPEVTNWLKEWESRTGMNLTWWTNQHEGFGARETRFIWKSNQRSYMVPSSDDVRFIEAGLPRHALRGGRIKRAYDPRLAVVFPQTDHGVFSVGEYSWCLRKQSRLLPLHPIWPGFAINTIFYAALLWLLTLGPFTARRMIRRKRGHCIKCGYDLRGEFSSGCPECGWRREAQA